MWRYLIFNGVWFAALVFSQFGGGRSLRVLALAALLASGVWAAAKNLGDPYVWAYYFVFSLVVSVGARQFKRWAFARSAALDQEIAYARKRREEDAARLAEQTRAADGLNQKANEIAQLYDKTKEMSQSLDCLATFLILGEVLAQNFRFRSIALALFNDETTASGPPEAVYGLGRSDFEGPFDKSRFLHDRSKACRKVYPQDQWLYRKIRDEKRTLFMAGPTPGPSRAVRQRRKSRRSSPA